MGAEQFTWPRRQLNGKKVAKSPTNNIKNRPNNIGNIGYKMLLQGHTHLNLCHTTLRSKSSFSKYI